MTWLMFWVIIIASVVATIMGCWCYYIFGVKPYKHTVIVRDMINNRKILSIDKARDFLDEDKVSYWKLKNEKNKEKKLMPMPPPDAIEMRNNGLKFVEVYRTETGEYVYIKDNCKIREVPQNIYADIPQKLLEIEDDKERTNKISAWKEEKLKAWKKDNNITESFQPLNTKHRSVLVGNIKRALERRGFSWKQNLPTIVSIGALVIIVICLFIFWGDLAKPVLEAQKTNLLMEQTRLEELNIIQDIQRGVQRINGETGGNLTSVVPN